MGIVKKIKNKVVVLVPLSGGLDSTYVAFKALSEGYIIQPVYFTLNGTNEQKHTIESQQSKMIHSILKKDFGENVLPLKKVRAQIRGGSQFNSWIHAIKDSIDLSEIGRIHLGATKSDIDDYTPMQELMERLENAKYRLEFNEIYYPVLDLTKEDMSNLLPKKYQDQVFTCEMPLYEEDVNDKTIVNQCGKCNACHLHKMNSLKLAGPFTLKKSLDWDKIQEFNELHEEYISMSNVYGQQV